MKEIYVALHYDSYPIVSSNTIEGLREGIDNFLGTSKGYAKFISFTSVDENSFGFALGYEGKFTYAILIDGEDTEHEDIHVYSIQFLGKS